MTLNTPVCYNSYKLYSRFKYTEVLRKMFKERKEDREYCLAIVLRSNLETCLEVKKFIKELEEQEKVLLVRDTLTTERLWISTKPPLRELEQK